MGRGRSASSLKLSHDALAAALNFNCACTFLQEGPGGLNSRGGGGGRKSLLHLNLELTCLNSSSQAMLIRAS